MTFAGLPLATLLAIGGAALALTVIFYILKLRRRPVAVPFSPLWHSVLGDRNASRLFSQLRRWLSLLLQLLLVIAMVLALGDPRPTASLGQGRNLVILVDASASMKAIDVKPNRLETAKEEARRVVRGLGGSDRALIVQMGPVPVPHSTLSSDATELIPAIDRVKASDTRADLARGLELARDALRGLSHAEVVVIGDGAGVVLEKAPDLGGAALRFVPVGRSGRNLALTEFSVRRYPLDKARLEVMAEVSNTSTERAEVELSLWGDGAIVDTERLSVEAGGRVLRFFPDVGSARHALEAKLGFADGRGDDLPADDRAFALVPERRRARVLVVTSGNTYLEAALLLDEYLDVTEVSPQKYPPAGAFDVTIFDGVAPPPAAEAGGLVYLNPPAEGGPLKIAKTIADFGFDVWDRKSPILRFAAMGDIQVATGNAFEPSTGDKVVGASDEGAVLVSGSRAGKRFIALSFDPRRSDFVLRPAWPLFVLNAIDSFGESDSSYLSAYRTGEVWRVPVPEGAVEAELTGPGGLKRRVPVQAGRAVTFGDQAGFYKLVTGRGAERVTSEFAANLSDLAESKISPEKSLKVGEKTSTPPPPSSSGIRRDIWVWLLGAVLVISLIEWLTYHRRITV
jgi:hypothetical protein